MSSAPATRTQRLRVALYCGICFALPMRVSFVYILTALLLVVWLAEGNYRRRLADCFRSPICLAFVAAYLIYPVGMLWTENIPAGWQMVDRYTPLVLFLLYWSAAEPSCRERYLSAFLAGVAVCAVLAHYNWLQLHVFPDWPRGIRVTKDPLDTAPFVDRILYTPILALGAYFALRRLAFAPSSRQRSLYLLVSVLLLSNLVFSGGRAGVVMFLVLTLAVGLEYFRLSFRLFVLSCLVLPGALFLTYQSSSYFADRVDNAVSDVRNFEKNQITSVGLRLVFWATSAEIVRDHPVLGVGSGDFEEAYRQARAEHWPDTPHTWNPHNQYLMTATTTGLVGLALLLSIFFVGWRATDDARTRAVLIGFAVVCLFESYLWRSNTALAFSVIMAVLTAGQPRPHAARSTVPR